MVRHRKPLPRTGVALCYRLIRCRPPLVGHRFPYEDGDTFVRAVEYIIDATGPAEAHAILDANAMALFRIND